MATTYTENPSDFCEIEAFVETQIKEMKSIFFSAERVFFMMHIRFKGILIWQIKKRTF